VVDSKAESGSMHAREKTPNEEFEGHRWRNLIADGRSVLISVVVTN